jgi:hypothetical protein
MIVFSNKCGQLGNRLFAFAHLIAFSEANELRVTNLSFDEYARYFQGTSCNLLCQYPQVKTWVRSNNIRSCLFLINKAILKILRLFKFHKSFFHKIEIADLPEYQFDQARFYDLKSASFLEAARGKQLVFLFGRFFRDYENLTTFQTEIRKYFKPIAEIQNEVNAFLHEVKLNAEIVIGVHIRRGDYEEFANGKYFYSVQNYAQKMRELQDEMNGVTVRFLVCSNEKIKMNCFDGLSVINGLDHLVKDMYALAECDYIMGPPSTYSLWASFYGNKPLYQIKDINVKIDFSKFVYLQSRTLYNFSFN